MPQGYAAGAPAAAGYGHSSPTGSGYGTSPPGDYTPGSPYPQGPQGPGAHSGGGVHALQNQFLDMSLGGSQVATS